MFPAYQNTKNKRRATESGAPIFFFSSAMLNLWQRKDERGESDEYTCISFHAAKTSRKQVHGPQQINASIKDNRGT
jgi:hypothetical protein